MKALRILGPGLLLLASLQGCGGKTGPGGQGGSGGARGGAQPVVQPSACLREHPRLQGAAHLDVARTVEAFAMATRDCGATLEDISAAANQLDR